MFLALAGAADMVSGIFRMTLWNQTIPARLRGRTAAIEMVSYMSGPYLGNAEAGFAARLLGLSTSVVTGGALCVLGSILITWALPELRQYQVLPAEPIQSVREPMISATRAWSQTIELPFALTCHLFCC
ncbi:MAG: hypothetical protein ACR2JB_22845 [Bryobacteraceae bacterium]